MPIPTNHSPHGFLRSRCQATNVGVFTRACASEASPGPPVLSRTRLLLTSNGSQITNGKHGSEAPQAKSLFASLGVPALPPSLISHAYRSAIRTTSDGSSQDAANNLDLATRAVASTITHPEGRRLRYMAPVLQIRSMRSKAVRRA